MTKDFLDLTGASGAIYRFRRLKEPHLRIAGNYAVVKPRASGFTVLFTGMTNDLSEVRAECPPEFRGGATVLYTRLNVSRAVREAEHADLDARYGTQKPDEGQ
jgi:hypothetical protein